MDRVIEDLANRFRFARRSALLSVCPGSGALDEAALLPLALERDSAAVHKRVFENSLRLGWGFTRFYGHELGLSELPRVLGALDVPCATGAWSTPCEGALQWERGGCGASGGRKAVCDYWREALDGLVLGLGGGTHHARHASRGAGNPACVDVLFVDPESPLRYGPIPEEMRSSLDRVVALAKSFDSRHSLEFVGLSEDVLFYRESAAIEGNVSVRSFVERAVQRRFPQLHLQDTSPRPVLGPQ